MSFQSSTESLLLNSSRLNADGNTVESFATEALLNDNGLGSSTGSLVNESVQELLNRLHIPETSFVDSDSSDGTVLSPVLGSPNLVLEETERSIYENGRPTHTELYEETGPLLSILYNKIQVFLLRNRLSLEFLRIYKRYVECLFESGLNPLDDRYFHLLQNELSESYDFTPRMEEILDAFLINPQNLIMKLVLFERKQTHSFLRRYFEAWSWNCELRRSLDQLERVWQDFLRRKYILLWSKKCRMVVFDFSSQGEEFRLFNLLSTSFDKWLGRVETADARKGLADHYLMDHILQRLVKRVGHTRKQGQQANSRYDLACQKSAFKRWRLRATERNFASRQVSFARFFFSKAQSKLTSYQELEDRAIFTRRLLLIGSCFEIWRSQCRKEGDRLSILTELESGFIKARTMKALTKHFKEREREVAARKQLDCISRRLFFEKIWRKTFERRLHLYSFQKIIEERLLAKYILLWKVRLYSRMKAGSFLKSQQLTRFFHTWQLEARQSKFDSRNRKDILRAQLLKWHDRSVSEIKVRDFQCNMLQRLYYGKWEERSNITRKAEQEADAMHNVLLITHSYDRWSSRARLIAEMDDRAKIFMALQALSIFQRGVAHVNEVYRFSEGCNLSPIYKNVLLRYFRLWKEQVAIQRSERLESICQFFEKNAQKNRLRSHLQLWLEKFKLYEIQCLTTATQIYDRNLQSRCLLRANQRLEDTRALLRVGDSLRIKSLSLSFLFRWKDRHDYVQELLVRLDTENNKKNLELLLNYLNFWSMKILKIKRNEETVQIFRKRWDRAAVRGLMLLWNNKVDDSPRKVQSTKSRHQLPLDSGLVTPVRRTAMKSNTIPGSEGVKRYRLEAMKSHYGRIRRAIPSPIKTSTTLSSMAKKKIDSEGEAFTWNHRTIPPPRLSLERINKNLASKIDRINFERIPEARLDPFTDADPESDPKVDTSFLEEEEDIEFDESPIRRM